VLSGRGLCFWLIPFQSTPTQCDVSDGDCGVSIMRRTSFDRCCCTLR